MQSVCFFLSGKSGIAKRTKILYNIFVFLQINIAPKSITLVARYSAQTLVLFAEMLCNRSD